ncbi:MAG: hypothetical protein HLUCCA01_08955 [Bacteroidetes bacterium HLUCCA01]|nr:MAG: hypothetical protein HLUCCA01_08955 [Bacteroidetes bacterium HLUCCA01]
MFSWSIFKKEYAPGSDLRSYAVQVLPKVRCFSLRLGEMGVLTDTTWVLFSEQIKDKTIYLFRPSGKVIIHQKDTAREGRWEIIGERTLMVKVNDKTFMFQAEFMDHTLLALKYDRHEEYVILVSEEKYPIFLNNIGRINTYLKNTYTRPSHKSAVKPMKTVYNAHVRYTVEECEYCGAYLSRYARDVFKVGNYQICSNCAEEASNVTRYTDQIPVSSELEQMKSETGS